MGTIVAEVIDLGERRDGRGRRITAERRRAELVRAYLASGLTMAAFARRERVKYPTFAHWVLKAAKAAPVSAPPSKPTPIRFTELRLPSPPAAGPRKSDHEGLEVRLPDGMVMRGNNPGELAALIRALRS